MNKKVFSSSIHGAADRIQRLKRKPGVSPGTVTYMGSESQSPPRVHITDFDPTGVKRQTINASFRLPEQVHQKRWIQVSGLHNTQFISEVGRVLEIPSLVLEDISNTKHAPKIEAHDQFLFIILKLPVFNDDNQSLGYEQVSILLFEELIVSFQESDIFHFESLAHRLKNPKARMREYGCEYFMYAMIDLTVDTCAFLGELFAEQLEAIEDEVMTNPHQNHVNRIHELKHRIASLRRVCRPFRDIADKLSAGSLPFISERMNPFITDLKDHVYGLLDSIEHHRDTATMVMESYLSLMSHRMNEIMKMLTIMSAIFIPLGFLAGLYGMNFDHMPELHLRYAYFGVLAVMASVATAMLIIFKVKKWL